MARTKCTARKTTGGKLASKLKAKQDAKRKRSQSDTSSSEDENSNSQNFPPKKKKIRQSTSQSQRFNPNANIRMPEDVDDKMLENIGLDHVQMTKVNCRLKVNCTNIQKYFTK